MVGVVDFLDARGGQLSSQPPCHFWAIMQGLLLAGLNRNHWDTLFEARVVIGEFKREHNHRHRHSALGYRTSAEYAAACRHTYTPVACCIN